MFTRDIHCLYETSIVYMRHSLFTRDIHCLHETFIVYTRHSLFTRDILCFNTTKRIALNWDPDQVFTLDKISWSRSRSGSICSLYLSSCLILSSNLCFLFFGLNELRLEILSSHLFLMTVWFCYFVSVSRWQRRRCHCCYETRSRCCFTSYWACPVTWAEVRINCSQYFLIVSSIINFIWKIRTLHHALYYILTSCFFITCAMEIITVLYVNE